MRLLSRKEPIYPPMKIKTTILTFCLILFSLLTHAQNKIFDDIEKTKDVQSIHVSKSLLSMISEMDTGNTDIALSHLADKLKQIDVYTSQSADAAKFMKTQANKFANDKSYETFMSVKNQSQSIIFYGKKEGETFKELIMAIEEQSGYKIMRFIGEFTAKDIQKVTKSDK